MTTTADATPHRSPTPTGSRRRALVIRHVAFEDLGLFAPVLADRGYDVTYLDAGVDRVAASVVTAADLLIVLGGPIGVGDVDRYPFVRDEIAAIGARVRAGRPTLGICLGAQLIAAALGAEVRPTGRVEIGYAPLELTAAGGNSVLAAVDGVPVLHWHGDEFAIPVGGVGLARTPGFENQAFTVGSHVLALQFHLEADPSRIESWLIGHTHELTANRIDPAQLRADAATHGPALATAGTRVLHAWLDGLDG